MISGYTTLNSPLRFLAGDWRRVTAWTKKLLRDPPPDRPPKKVFKKKNEEIPTLPSYLPGDKIPETFFDSWPFCPLPDKPRTKVEVARLEELAEISGLTNCKLKDGVLSDLKNGAPLYTTGVGREITSSSNAPSAALQGEKTSDAVASWIKGDLISTSLKLTKKYSEVGAIVQSTTYCVVVLHVSIVHLLPM